MHRTLRCHECINDSLDTHVTWDGSCVAATAVTWIMLMMACPRSITGPSGSFTGTDHGICGCTYLKWQVLQSNACSKHMRCWESYGEDVWVMHTVDVCALCKMLCAWFSRMLEHCEGCYGEEQNYANYYNGGYVLWQAATCVVSWVWLFCVALLPSHCWPCSGCLDVAFLQC